MYHAWRIWVSNIKAGYLTLLSAWFNLNLDMNYQLNGHEIGFFCVGDFFSNVWVNFIAAKPPVGNSQMVVILLGMSLKRQKQIRFRNYTNLPRFTLGNI